MAVIMGGLVVSFAIWGIGDIFRGFGLNSAIKIGKTEISIEQFRQFYNDRLQQIGRQAGRPISVDQARERGIDRQLLAQLVAETTLDEQAKKLGLAVSNDEIVNRITNDPGFRGLTGQFDRARFDAVIRQNNFSEGRYVDAAVVFDQAAATQPTLTIARQRSVQARKAARAAEQPQ